jgi:hypothetical protein
MKTMVEIVYLLCGFTSILCTVLLVRGYRKSGVKLLLWSSLCFAGFALNNVLLVVDLMLYPDVNLAILRTLSATVGICVLIYGLIWELP